MADDTVMYGNQPGVARRATTPTDLNRDDLNTRQAEPWDPNAKAQMDEVFRQNGVTPDDAAYQRWLNPSSGYIYKRGEVTGDGQRLAPYQAGGKIEEYWKMRMGHDARGTEHDPEGVARERLRRLGGGLMGGASLNVRALQALMGDGGEMSSNPGERAQPINEVGAPTSFAPVLTDMDRTALSRIMGARGPQRG